jgi:hypothetical protein
METNLLVIDLPKGTCTKSVFVSHTVRTKTLRTHAFPATEYFEGHEVLAEYGGDEDTVLF